MNKEKNIKNDSHNIKVDDNSSKEEEKKETQPLVAVADQHVTSLLRAGAEKDEYNINIVRDYDGSIDIFYLSKKDPAYEYRFLRDEQKNLSIKTGNILEQKGGWQLVPREHLVKLGFNERDISPDGLCRRGDTILARIPKDLFKVKDEAKKKKVDDRTRSMERITEKGDPNTGGKELHQSMKGIQTKEELKGNWK